VDDLLAVQEVKGFQHLTTHDLDLGFGEASVQFWKRGGVTVSSPSRRGAGRTDEWRSEVGRAWQPLCVRLCYLKHSR
jgi:hypothetical protein